jgi:DNA mismatch endonuclease (patch repair protein)
MANASYWIPKLQRTVERDRLNDKALRGAGWVVLRLWEHQALEEAVAAVTAAVAASPADASSVPRRRLR